MKFSSDKHKSCAKIRGETPEKFYRMCLHESSKHFAWIHDFAHQLRASSYEKMEWFVECRLSFWTRHSYFHSKSQCSDGNYFAFSSLISCKRFGSRKGVPKYSISRQKSTEAHTYSAWRYSIRCCLTVPGFLDFLAHLVAVSAYVADANKWSWRMVKRNTRSRIKASKWPSFNSIYVESEENNKHWLSI